MLKFFRKIRFQLVDKNKTGKYFKYAIGEIILVVIGILIALQINNWNEERKSAEKTNLLLVQVQKELAFNIENTYKTSDIYRRKDSLVNKILNKEVTYNDYKSNRFLTGFIIDVQTSVGLSDDDFNSLMQNDNNFTSEQQLIVSKLKTLYGNNKRLVDHADEVMSKKYLEFGTKLRNEKEWVYNYFFKRETTDEMINYLLTDPFYLNEVLAFWGLNLGNHSQYILNFQHQALELYNELSNLLNLEKESSVVGDLSEKQHYVGTYQSEELNETYQFTIENDNLKCIFSRDANPRPSFYIYPRSKTYFSLIYFFGKLTYDKDNNVTGFIMSRQGNERFFRKIE